MKELRFLAIAVLTLIVLTGGTAVVSAITASTTINSIISPVISLFTTSGTVNANVTPTSGGAQTVQTDTVTVSTNDIAGYTLTLADTDTVTNLVSAASDTIPASAGTQTTPVVQAVNTWGYAVAGLGGFNASGYSITSNTAISGTQKYAGMPSSASPNILKTTATVASNDVTTVYYAVAANFSQHSGTYTDSVTYTATTN